MEAHPDARNEYAQIVRLHERTLERLHKIREELTSPSTVEVLGKIRSKTGSSPEEHVQELARQIEEAIRALQLSESKIREEIDAPTVVEVEGVPNLPSHLMRFLADRKDTPGFTYRVTHDEVRGWIIHWKEFTGHGTVRGSGQFYERPYAFLDE